jgi:hypothetical protein
MILSPVVRTGELVGKKALTPWRVESKPGIGSRMVRMPRSGIHFSLETIEKVQGLLEKTDLSLVEIAERIDCSRSAVASINRKYGIRIYGKKRSSWTLRKDLPNKS